VDVHDWFSKFSSLINSSFCRKCIYQMSERMPADLESSPMRDKRLGHDLKGLAQDAPEGIEALPLDSCYYHWQAPITGPVGSPYEGGVFYLYLKVPMLYPFRPPEVRFLTKIFHPNVNRHGDIGIDSIQQGNWVSGLTLPKVLISIQSLLTDPYCDVCMEPEIGQLYRTDRETFDSIARQWTWKFAMHDVLLNCEVHVRPER
jgi:ubiquitin-conjugating enzyme E2 D/E